MSVHEPHAEPLDPAEVVDGPIQPYPVASSRPLFAGLVFDGRTDHVQLPGGPVVRRDIVVHTGAVGIVALDDHDRVLMVRQYRHPAGRLLWEPPAGLLDVAGEPPHLTAARELHEEANMRAAEWHVLVDLYTSPGGNTEALRLFLARGLTPVAPHERIQGEHEEADMPYAWLDLDEAVTRVMSGRLHNPTAVVGILAAAAARARGYDGLRPADAAWPERGWTGDGWAAEPSWGART